MIGGGAGDRVGEIEVGRRASGTATCPTAPPRPPASRYRPRSPGATCRRARDADARRTARRAAPRASRRAASAEQVGERAQDRPVLARVAGREGGARRHLHAAFGVDVDAGFLRVGGARQDHVGAMRAGVAVGADVDDEGAGRDVDLVGAEQEQDVERAGLGHLGAPCGRLGPARSRYRGRRPGTPRCAGPHSRSSRPAAPPVDAALAASASMAAPSGRASAPCPITRAAARPRPRIRRPRLAERLRPGAEIVVRIGEVGLLADQPDREAAVAPALADARVEHRRFLRGLAPTISIASACSMPATVGLKR